MRFVFVVFALAMLTMPARAAGFADWGAIIVAGDHRAHNGADSEVFDDGRHDVGAALMRLGFKSGNIEEFSVKPDKYTSPVPQVNPIRRPSPTGFGTWPTAPAADVFFYFTSHGSPDGVVVADGMIAPGQLARMLNNACGDRPTVAVISACYSGVFVPVRWRDQIVL